LIVFPASREKDLTIYYRDLVGKISFSESQYFYSVRPRNGLAYSAVGVERELSDATNKVYTIMKALRRPAGTA
jgi:hypothetical protein